jgi:hypothetical protein
MSEIHRVARQGDPFRLRRLIESGADPNEALASDGATLRVSGTSIPYPFLLNSARKSELKRKGTAYNFVGPLDSHGAVTDPMGVCGGRWLPF